MFRPSKYKNHRVVEDGIKFDSKSERDYYLLLRANKVKILELQPKVYLTKTRILYKPDFLIEEEGIKIYIDVKGFLTPVFNIKKRLWKDYGIGELRLVKKSGKTFKIIGSIYGKEE